MSNTKEKKKMGLTTKIFISLLAGALFGVILCYLVPKSSIKDDVIVEGILYVIGQGFIRCCSTCILFDRMWKYVDWRYKKTRNSRRAYTRFLSVYNSRCSYSCVICR